MNRLGVTLSFILAILLVGMSINVAQIKGSKITGQQIVTPVPTTANIFNYFAVTASPELSGIIFNIPALPAVDADALGNDDGGGDTLYFITVDTDSNVNIDFCIQADGDLIDVPNTIPLESGSSGYTWDDATTAATPALPGAFLTTSYVLGSTGITPTSSNYYRFWLDVGSAQAPGTYTNTVNFQAVQTATACV